MAKKFKELRERAGINKSQLAEMLNVDYRTITNWEKENGTYPSLDVAKDIAEALKVSTYEVFEAFVFDDNKGISQNDAEPFYSGFISLENYSEGNIAPKEFFRYLFSDKWEFGEGIVQHNYNVFNFAIATSIHREYDGEIRKVGELKKVGDYALQPVEFSDKEKAKELFEYPYGFFVADKKMNIIVFSEENIECCRFVSNSCGNLTFELVLNSPVFQSMEEEIRLLQKSSVYLTIFDYRQNGIIMKDLISEWIPNFRFDFDKNNVLGKFIKSLRKRYGLNQSEFACGIITPVDGKYMCPEISNKTINKWETGIARPSLLQLFLLSESYDFSVQTLLDQFDAGFFVENSVINSERVYDIGLNYWFSRSKDLECWKNFLDLFKLAKREMVILLSDSDFLGLIEIGEEELMISDIAFSATDIIIKSKYSSEIVVPIESVKSIKPKNNLGNLVYETEITYEDEGVRMVKINLSYFYQCNSDDV